MTSSSDLFLSRTDDLIMINHPRRVISNLQTHKLRLFKDKKNADDCCQSPEMTISSTSASCGSILNGWAQTVGAGVEQTSNLSWDSGKEEHSWRRIFLAWHSPWPLRSSQEDEGQMGQNRRRVKDGGRRGRRRRRSEADLIHRFDFIIKGRGKQEMNPNLSSVLKGPINLLNSAETSHETR